MELIPRLDTVNFQLFDGHCYRSWYNFWNKKATKYV